MPARLEGSELSLYGSVGALGLDDFFSSSDVTNALAIVGRENPVTVRLNSGGGVATEGAAIHNALAAHKGEVTVVVEGIAASAASLIAMGAKKTLMSPGSVLMIHDPMTLTMGNAAQHHKTIEALDALANSYASIYADKSGMTTDEARELMRAETWMTRDKAIELGFADGKTESGEVQPTAFAYGVYANAPAPILAFAKGVAPLATQKEAPAMSEQQKDDDLNMGIQDNEVHDDDVVDHGADSAEAAEIVEACVKAGVPTMAASLIREGATMDVAKARIAMAGEIATMVATSNKRFGLDVKADDYIAKGFTAEKVAKEILAQIVEKQSPEVSPHVAVATSPVDNPLKKAVARVNARKFPAA